MNKCIYCFCSNQNKFNAKEHVLPQLFGHFSPFNLTLKGSVCDACNNEIFSPLENKFKEDSEEGLFSQMLNLENKSMVRVRNQQAKLKCFEGQNEDLFNEVFPFLQHVNGEFKVIILPQIKIKNSDGSYEVYLADALKKIKQIPSKFSKFKSRINKLSKRQIFIFIPAKTKTGTEVDEIIQLAKDYGIKYNEKERKYRSPADTKDKNFPISIQCILNQDNARVLAKITFNYFAYNALFENSDILFKNEFDEFRNFIIGKSDISSKKIIKSIDQDVILGDEKIKNTRAVVHILLFNKVDNEIIARMTFFGRRVYEIPLGNFPSQQPIENFGCGHLFNPYNHSIHPLTQLPRQQNLNIRINDSFGLNKRFR